MRYREARRVPGGKRPSSERRLADPVPSGRERDTVDGGDIGTAYGTAAIVVASEALAAVPHDGQNRSASVSARPHEEQVIRSKGREVF